MLETSDIRTSPVLQNWLILIHDKWNFNAYDFVKTRQFVSKDETWNGSRVKNQFWVKPLTNSFAKPATA